MKVITLLPVKNEGWILRSTLKNMSDFSDHIIIADQNSTDDSLSIYKEFEKVTVIQNNNQNHNNSVRWQLLDFARERFGNENLIICIDADEMIQPEAIQFMKDHIVKDSTRSISFTFPWIQLWGTTEKHRADSVWKNNYKAIAFLDDGTVDYERKKVLNDHTGRVPKCMKEIKVDRFPLLHYQYIDLRQAEIKQAWYRCSELMSGNDPKKINHKYSVAKNDTKVVLQSAKKEWFKNLPTIQIQYDIETDWRYEEIIRWFDSKGIEFFEPLDIWHAKNLKEIFIEKIGRLPKPKKFPSWLVWLNTIKNIIKN